MKIAEIYYLTASNSISRKRRNYNVQSSPFIDFLFSGFFHFYAEKGKSFEQSPLNRFYDALWIY